MKKIIAAFSVIAMCLPLISLAHPGHGESDGFTITHYFTEPVHVVLSLGILTAVVLYIRNLRKRTQRN